MVTYLKSSLLFLPLVLPLPSLLFHQPFCLLFIALHSSLAPFFQSTSPVAPSDLPLYTLLIAFQGLILSQELVCHVLPTYAFLQHGNSSFSIFLFKQ